MNKELLIEELSKAGYSIKQLATLLGVSRHAVYQSLNGNGSRRIRVEIAQKVRRIPSQIWTAEKNRKKVFLDDGLFWGEKNG